MFKKTALFLATAFISSQYSQALQPISLETSVGRRWADYDTIGLQSNEMNVSGFIQIGSAPVAGGLGLSIVDFSNKDIESSVGADSVSASSGYAFFAEIKAWLPKDVSRLSILPYIKYSQDLMSNYDIKAKNDFYTYKVKMESSGYKLAIGTSYDIDKKITLFGEYSLGTQEMKAKEKLSNNASNINRTSKYDYDSKALLVGLNMKV